MNILLTGCSKGVGLETTKKLLESGHNVYGISRTETTALMKLKDSYFGQLNHLCYDLSRTNDVYQFVFKDWLGNVSIDGFVNNAAIAYDDIITNLQMAPLEIMFKVNVFTPYMFTKYVIRNMILNRKKGSIIHVSSISVHTGYKGLSMYASTKGALEAFSKNISREWGEKGIRSNCLVAGFMDTDMSSSLTEIQKNRIYQRTALKQSTQIDSVASTILFLLSNGSQSITGQNIHVDSGTL